MAHHLEIRKKVLKYIKKGHSVYQAAEVFDVSKSAIYEWKKRDDLAPTLNHTKGYKVDKKRLEARLSEQSDLLLRELSEEFNVSISAIYQLLKKLGYTYKKSGNIHRSRSKETS